MNPYKHQNEAIDNVINALNKDDRTQLIMSCGTGKSLTSMWSHENYVKSLDGSLTVLFYPSLFLVNQTYNTYKDNTTLNFNPLVVCSDKAIGENENDDVFELDASEVKYPVTTNIDDMKLYLQDTSIKDKIIFVTYQSSQLVGEALNGLGLKADLGIFDEAHKTATANIDSKFAHGLKDENLPIAKRLFMTATPRHIKFNVDNEEDEEVEVFSMNNAELYGNVAYEYPMRNAINDKRITDYKIMGILIDDKYIDSYTNELKPFSEDIINEAKIKAVNEAMNKYKLNKALIFNSDIATSKEIEKYSNTTIFNKTIKHLDGSSKHSYREEVLKELKDNEQFVITNAKLFTEGVDLPTIDMVALFRNVKSEIDIIQTVGRVQRTDKNNPNKVGYILLPIFVSNLENIDEEIKTNKDLLYTYEIINSLKENDELLKSTFEYKKKSNSKEQIKNPNFEISYLYSDFLISKEQIDIINEKIKHKIETVILDKKGVFYTNKEWKNLFIEYDNGFGFETLTLKTVYKDKNIGTKVSSIREKYSNSSSWERKQMVKFWDCFPKGFIEKQKKTEEEWKELFDEYNRELGFATLSSTTRYKDKKIGTKFTHIKKIYNDSSFEKQKEILNFWGFPKEIMATQKTNSDWRDLFLEYDREVGINNLKQSTVFKNVKLGKVFNRFKNQYIKLSPEQQKQMREFWDCFPESFWENKNNVIKKKEWKKIFFEYASEVGIDNINTITEFKGINFSGKIYNLKFTYSQSTPEQQKEMRKFWDCFPESFWEYKGAKKPDEEWKILFMEFIKEFGLKELTVNIKYKNENLGNKIIALKTKYKKSTPEQQKAMEGFWDCFSDDFWERKIADLKTKEEWKELFIQYDREIGLKKITQKTVFNKENIGFKGKQIVGNYRKSTPEQQKEMREFWDCFPDDFWEKKVKSDQERKELFIQYDKEIGFENLIVTTKFNNENIGTILHSIKAKYKKSTPEQQKEMREFWNCFPETMWEKKK
jgi:superfamily II DNA or RNA helicase